MLSKLLVGLVSRTVATSADGRCSNTGRGNQRLKKWHMMLPCLVFTTEELEQGWLALCEYNVTGWGIMLICGTVLRWTAILKPACVWTSTVDLTPTVAIFTFALHSHYININNSVRIYETITLT